MEGCVLLIADVPSGIDFGIDCMSFETGPNFKGISMIPAGLHFIYYSTGMGARQGFFVDFTESCQLVVCTWDSSNEEILPISTLSQESIQILKQNISRGELNINLGPYPLNEHHIWLNVSNFLSNELLILTDCLPKSMIFPGEFQDCVMENSNLQNKNLNLQVKPFFEGVARIAKFCDIRSCELAWRESFFVGDNKSKPSFLTQLSVDKSEFLKHIIQVYYQSSWTVLLGELQLSFLTFILLYSFQGLNHWKILISHICSCKSYFTQNLSFTSTFIKILYAQLNFCPTDFFDDELSKNNFLRPILSTLIDSLESEESVASATRDTLHEHKKRLVRFLEKKFGFDFENNSSYYLDLDEDQPIMMSNEEYEASLKRIGLMDSLGVTDEDKNECFSTQPHMDKVSHAFLQEELINHEMENKKYSWRYPLIYESMLLSNGKEDMIMTASRIIDEFDYLLSLNNEEQSISAKLRQSRHEAFCFIRDEIRIAHYET
eukprot:gene16941-23258_t